MTALNESSSITFKIVDLLSAVGGCKLKKIFFLSRMKYSSYLNKKISPCLLSRESVYMWVHVFVIPVNM